MSILESLIMTAAKFTKNILVNRIKINITNTQSRNTLHHGRCVHGIGNKLITPLPVMINRRETGSIKLESTIRKANGIVMMISWKISIIGKNKWFVFIGCETDPDFPDERFIKKYLKENGNTGSNTLDFEAHSTTVDGSINDGNNAQLNIGARSWGLLDRLFS
ncbi:hypothetical protein RhiirA5_419597 [Rhizophagus irregularis]|uniref:Uncharacterized protein n=1 Tax=Rhizophagus irregularis TaxID=588596 RepID=A0A2N0PHW3_9GLOM|nr:hypothetical protein RhiirA5_419597 [Rhizophagus irregularis]